MLVARPADPLLVVVRRTLVLAAYPCCGLVIVSFSLFARDQLVHASSQQQHELVASGPPGSGAAAKRRGHGQPRALIDGAAKALTSPFDSIVQSNSPWVRRGVPTVVALLVYGVGLGYLARYSSGLS